MSDTSVLLPSARIALFSTDAKSRKVAEKLSDDWRFARVDISTQNAGLSEAIAYYQEHTSPELLIIQTDTIDESFTEQLGELAGHCAEGTDAIVIGPDNDVQLYRKLIAMGVSDYIVRPLETEVFSDVIAKALINKLGVSGSRLIVTLGGKGGVGVSTIAQSLALGLSGFMKQKTLLMDAAGGWSANCVALGAEPSTTLKEAAKAAQKQDRDSLKRMIVAIDDKLSVLASGGDILLEETISAEALEQVLGVLMAEYPVVIFDASGAAPELKKAVVMLAHKILLISTPDVFSLRQTRALLHEIKEVRGVAQKADDAFLSMILNGQGTQERGELTSREIEEMLEHKLAHTIPHAPKAVTAMKGRGRDMMNDAEARTLMGPLLPLVIEAIPGLDKGDLAGSDQPQKAGGISGLLGKLTKKG